MKKIITALVFCLAFLPQVSIAGPGSAKTHISNTLSLVFEISRKRSISASHYDHATFMYKGMPVMAVKSKTSNWAGYFKTLSANDLPVNAVSQIEARYKTGKIEKIIMYFNDAGEVNYFAQITLGHKCVILKIRESGIISVFS